MKKIIKIIAISLAILVLVSLATYRIWFYNPYKDELRLDPRSVFSEESLPQDILIRNAALIDVVEGRVVPTTHIHIRGDSIAGIYRDELPDTLEYNTEYDAQGKYVMPGLIDVHTHLAMHPQLLAGIIKDRDSLVTRVALEQFVRYGVTTILTLGGGGANDEEMAELKRLEQRNSIVSPLLFSAGDCITAPGSHPITTIMRLSESTTRERLHRAGVSVIAEGEDPESMIMQKKRLGLDGVKVILESGPPPWYPKPRLSVETAGRIVDRANKQGLPVYVHANAYNEFSDAVSLGTIRGIMHGVIDSLVDDHQLFKRMKDNDIWYVPTLSVLYGFQSLRNQDRLEDEYLQAGVSPRALKSLANPIFKFGFGQALNKIDLSLGLDISKKNLARINAEGIRVAMGTDACTPFNFPGYGAHIEMELMTQAGLSNEEVLRIATVNGAEFLGVNDLVGTLEPGKLANMLILEENPLDDIRHTRSIEKVVLKGRMIDLTVLSDSYK